MDYATARANMVNSQLKPNRITDKRLLTRFGQLPRENFVGSDKRSIAYQDNPVTISSSRELLSPQVTAHLLQELALEKTDKVLICAAGTGYSTLLIAPLVTQVIAIEDDPDLLDYARRAVLDAHLASVELRSSDARLGAKDEAPFDKILLDTAVAEVPAELIAQLKDGGRLTAICKGADGLMEATLITKQGRTVVHTPLFETKARLHPGFQTAEEFVF